MENHSGLVAWISKFVEKAGGKGVLQHPGHCVARLKHAIHLYAQYYTPENQQSKQTNKQTFKGKKTMYLM